MKLSHEVLLALAYVSQISDPDSVRSRFIESLNGLDESFSFEFYDRLPPGVPEDQIIPITTLNSSFGFAVMAKSQKISEVDQAVCRNAFKFLAILIENRHQASALKSKNESLLKEIKIEKSLVRTVLDTMPIGVWVEDGNGKILMENPANEKIRTDTLYIGKDWRVGTGKSIAFEDWGIAHAIKACETVTDQEIDIECLDGSLKTILHSAAPLLNDDRRVVGAIGINQNITERKRTEKALKISEGLFRDMVEKLPFPLAVGTTDNKTEYVNPKFTEVFGYTIGDIPNQKAWREKFFPDHEYRSKMSSEVDRWIEKNEYLTTFTRRYTDKWSREHDVIVTVMNLKDRFYNIIEDITERKQAKKDKEKLQAQLQQALKMESIGTLTGGIAHDFNNIMAIILGNTELALDDVPKWNSAHSSLEEIKTASLRAKNIVKQLLSFSRKTDQKLQPIQIASVIKDALQFMRSTIPTTINIHRDIQTTYETILADPTQINQIIMNLCINASHAMEQTGGDLTVTVEKVILDYQSLKDYPDLKSGDHVKIMISDTGPGIAPGIIDQIFDPYFTTKEVGKGSGMGLAVVHGIVKSHDGAIAIDSSLGKGTKFTILFPLATAKTMVNARTLQDIPRGSETILFVDDEISITKMVKRMFERLGYKVETATTPQDALELFRSNPDHFDLVITDMTMPQMTGVKLSEKLMEIRSDIPIIICTGHSALVDEEKAKELGLAAYVMKPINMLETAQTIRKVLDK